jgi:hypothetical protein
MFPLYREKVNIDLPLGTTGSKKTFLCYSDDLHASGGHPIRIPTGSTVLYAILLEPFKINPAKLLAKPCTSRTTTSPQATVYAGCSALSASMVVSAVAAGGRSICSLTLIVRYS